MIFQPDGPPKRKELPERISSCLFDFDVETGVTTSGSDVTAWDPVFGHSDYGMTVGGAPQLGTVDGRTVITLDGTDDYFLFAQTLGLQQIRDVAAITYTFVVEIIGTGTLLSITTSNGVSEDWLQILPDITDRAISCNARRLFIDSFGIHDSADEIFIPSSLCVLTVKADWENGVASFYINGRLVSQNESFITGGNTGDANASAVNIGRKANNTSYCNSRLAGFCAHQRALTDKEVEQIARHYMTKYSIEDSPLADPNGLLWLSNTRGVEVDKAAGILTCPRLYNVFDFDGYYEQATKANQPEVTPRGLKFTSTDLTEMIGNAVIDDLLDSALVISVYLKITVNTAQNQYFANWTRDGNLSSRFVLYSNSSTFRSFARWNNDAVSQLENQGSYTAGTEHILEYHADFGNDYGSIWLDGTEVFVDTTSWGGGTGAMSAAASLVSALGSDGDNDNYADCYLKDLLIITGHSFKESRLHHYTELLNRV